MQNKKAWLRIAEASIASLIIITAILFMMTIQSKESGQSEEIYEKQKQILNIILENNELRNEILQGELTNTKIKIKELIPQNLEFEINICVLDSVCPGPLINNKDIYTTERIITATPSNYNPRKIRFFVWIS